MKSLSEKIVLVTGATDGLGLHLSGDLAARGAAVLLHGRDPAKGARILESMRGATGNDRLRYYNADFADLGAVRDLAKRVGGDHSGIDVLINNAGLGAGPDPTLRETGVDGLELRLTVNYLAPFLLTRLLLPALLSISDREEESRIVNVASCAQQAIDFDDPMLEKSYDGMRAYSQSKLALIMATFDLAADLKESSVTANAVHPATLMDTKMVREWFGQARTSVDEGARAVTRLVVSKDLAGVSGEYFDGVRKGRANPQAYDDAARRRLRKMTEKWVGLKDR